MSSISAEKFARTGVAVKMTTKITGASGDYVHQTYFLICKNDVYYMMVIQARNADVDEDAVDFVVNNMYLE